MTSNKICNASLWRVVVVVIFLVRDAFSATIVIDTTDALSVSDSVGYVNVIPKVPGGTSNSNQSTFLSGLKDTAGSPVSFSMSSPVSISLSGWYLLGNESNRGSMSWRDPDPSDYLTPDLAMDYIWHERSDRPGIIRFDGLDSNLEYDLRILSVRETRGVWSDHIRATYTANGRFPDEWTASSYHDAYWDGWSTGELIKWSSLAATASGSIEIDARSRGLVGSYAYVNAIELIVVPEPETICYVLLAMGSVGIQFLRRRTVRG